MLSISIICQFQLVKIIMNKQDVKTRIQIIKLLIEGNSIRTVSRLIGCSINTITKLLIDTGSACYEYQDKTMHKLFCQHVQCTVVWAFCNNKVKNVKQKFMGNLEQNNIFTWIAKCSETKFILSFMLGKWNEEYAHLFINDLISLKLSNMVQLKVDEQKLYLQAIEGKSNYDIDYSILKKYFNNLNKLKNQKIYYAPKYLKEDKLLNAATSKDISKNYIKLSNPERHINKQEFNQNTSKLDRKLKKLKYSLALQLMYYNFGCIHKSLSVTPAMKAGLSDHVWKPEEILELVPDSNIKKH